MDQVVEDLLSCLDDPALALLQWNEAFGVVQVLRYLCDQQRVVILFITSPLLSKTASWAQLSMLLPLPSA